MCGMCVQCNAKSWKSGRGKTAQMLVIKLINET